MKTFILLILLGICNVSFAQRHKEQIEKDFNRIWQIVESGHFTIKFSAATPYNGTNILTDSAQIVISDTIAIGYLPYYTRYYSLPMTGAKGIVFDNTILNKSIKIKGKNDKKVIKYQFDVIGKNDAYKLQMDIQYDGTCYLYVVSKQRGPISYIGTIRAI